MLVTLHSLVLLESRCAECYADDSATFQRGLCCDGDNMESCPGSCDVYLRFCQLERFRELGEVFEPAEELGTKCSRLTPVVEGWIGINYNTSEVYQYCDIGPIGLDLSDSLSNPVIYAVSGKWIPVRK